MSENPFIFQHGDVDLKATWMGQPVIGRVCSSNLSFASSVWSNFLFPPWIPQNSTTKPVESIDCSEDDGPALLILLNIAHVRFKKVPKQLCYMDLYHLAVLCDQYDCLDLIEPWLEHWMKNEEEESLRVDQSGWLFIAWAFGREETFENTASFLVQNIRRDELQTEMPQIMPHYIVESIVDARKAAIEALLRIPYDKLMEYEATKQSNTTKPKASIFGSALQRTVCKIKAFELSCPDCDRIIHGSIVSSLQRAGLYPGLYPPQSVYGIADSVAELASTIKNLQIDRSPWKSANMRESGALPARPFVINDENNSAHSRCGLPDLEDRVDSVIENIPNPVLDSHRLHMRAVHKSLYGLEEPPKVGRK